MRTPRYSDLSLTAERRAGEVRVVPEEEPVRLASDRVSGVPASRSDATAAVTQRRQPPVLTRRERRVKDILLKELIRMSDVQSLTYAEKQHLEKHLSVAFIDAQLARMREQTHYAPMVAVVIAVYLVLFAASVANVMAGSFSWYSLWFIVPLVPGVTIPLVMRRSLRRKMFIYEALRELCDEDEEDLALDTVVKASDALIERIVERELEIERRYPIRLA